MIGKGEKMAKNNVKKERAGGAKIAARLMALILAILMVGGAAVYGIYLLFH